MDRKTIITCAVTGAGDTSAKSPHVPVTPRQIADSCIEAAEAGAAIVHIHVRDPETGKAGRGLDCYREVVERVRASGTDVLLNLTCGMGGELHLNEDDPSIVEDRTDLVSVYERMAHVDELRPEICTIDCGSMNFGGHVVVNRNSDLRKMAKLARDWGVKPELEVFDMGQVGIALSLIEEGLVIGDPMFQFCLGITNGAPASVQSIIAMRSMIPDNAVWSCFAIGRAEMPMVAQAMLLGGNVRVGLEDNLYLEKGVLATNGQLVERACDIIEILGGTVAGPDDAREILGLPARSKAKVMA